MERKRGRDGGGGVTGIFKRPSPRCQTDVNGPANSVKNIFPTRCARGNGLIRRGGREPPFPENENTCREISRCKSDAWVSWT